MPVLVGILGGANFQQLTSDIVGHFAAKKQQRKYWQEYQKRYQTAVHDMRAAGLNPMLALGGAGDPHQAPIFHGTGDSETEFTRQPPAVTDQLQAQKELDQAAADRQRQDTATGRAQESLLAEEKITNVAQRKVIEIEGVKKAAETLEANARRENVEANTALVRSQLPAAELKALLPRMTFKLLERGQAMRDAFTAPIKERIGEGRGTHRPGGGLPGLTPRR